MPVGTKNAAVPGLGVHHIAVRTRDLDASLRLYRDVLGMQEVARWGEHPTIVLLDVGDGSHMELFAPQGDAPKDAAEGPVIHIALATTDARAATERVREAGYEVTVEPKEMNLGGLEVTLSFFRGPSGELVEFFEGRS